MRSWGIIMDDFKDLNGIYTYIEANAINYKFSNQIGDIFKNFRDLILKENKKEESSKAQWELDFFSFGIHKGELGPLFTAADKEGKEIKYPDLENFNDAKYEYLIERLDNSKNPLIKSRYSIILWFSPKKHGKYAKIAVDSLLELVKLYEDKDKIEPGEHWGYKAFQSIENAYYIGLNAKYGINYIKLEILRLIKIFNPKSSSSFVLKLNLMELMLKDKKNFIKDDFLGFQKVCWEISSDLISRDNLHGSITILEMGGKIDAKTGLKTYIWRKRIAKCYEALMENAINNENFAAFHFCLSAIENYKKIKDDDKIKELEEQYAEMNETFKMGKVEFELEDLNKHLSELEELAENMSENNSLEIIDFLMNGNKVLLPNFEHLDELTDGIIESFPLLAMCSKVDLDPRGHPAEHYVSDDEKKYHEIIRHYKLFIRFISQPFLFNFLVSVIKKEKLSASIILDFLRNESWLGRILVHEIYGTEVKHDWVGLLAPSIYEYFRQMEFYLNNPLKNIPNYILCMDSLVLKLEGIIRDFCSLNGITTFKTFSKKGKPVVQEKPLNKLLDEEKLEEILGKDDLLFFKVLLIEQGGYNLRNEIAHSLISSQNYEIGNMHLLLLAVFRLAKYKIEEKNY